MARPSFTSMESAISKKDVRTLTLSLSLTLTVMTCKRTEGKKPEPSRVPNYTLRS